MWKYEKEKKNILKYRKSHFTPAGSMHQVLKWLARPYDESASDLRCCTNPNI
jgi:hypothetical protein